jgi:GNAT superfamily N-acetyltransferase
VDDQTPEIAISVIKEERGKGIGTMLLEAMKKLLQETGYNQISLSVQKQNPAAKLYLRLGYEIVKETQEEWIMILPLCSSKCFVNEKRIEKNYTE